MSPLSPNLKSWLRQPSFLFGGPALLVSAYVFFWALGRPLPQNTPPEADADLLRILHYDRRGEIPQSPQQIRFYQRGVAQAIAAANAAGRAAWPFLPISAEPSRYPGDRMSLDEKADYFEKDIAEHFSAWEGRIFRYTDAEPWDLGDMALWQGVRPGQVALRWDGGHLAADRDAMGRLMEGMRMLVPKQSRATLWRGIQVDPAGRILRKEGEASYDSLTGFVFGLSLAWKYGDNQIRDQAAVLTRRLASGLRESGWRILDDRGKTTPYGDLRPAGGAIAGRALVLLNLLKLEAVSHPADDEASRDYAYHFEDLGLKYAAAEPVVRVFPLYYNPPDINLAALSLYALLTLEASEPVRSVYVDGMQHFVDLVKGEGNSMVLFMGLRDWSRFHPPLSREAARELRSEAVHTLEEMAPVCKEVKRTLNSQRSELTLVRHGEFMYSKIPLPVWQRPAADFLWQRTPYSLDDHLHLRYQTQKFTGLDYLLAYWIGKKHGWL